MPLTITQRAMARITAHGLGVYPLEGYGLLLGLEATELVPGFVIAALPIGKTERWYESVGRFARVSEALAAATNLFTVSALRPVGTYCTVYESSRAHLDALLAGAPRSANAPWLVLRPLDGGERILASYAKVWNAGKWRDESLTVHSPRIEVPERNPRRIAIAWNRAWGVLDYGNRHEVELARLGIANRAP